MHNNLSNNNIVGKQFHFLPICHSTNDMLSQMLKEGKAVNGHVLMAGSQFSGKGQRGNVWESEPNKNLTFSILLSEFELKAGNQFLISMAIANGVQKYVQSKVQDEVFVKWPNDIIVGNKKISGILIENGLKGSEMDYSIIGIGLNLNQLNFNYPNATSLSAITETEFDLEKQLEELCQHLDEQITQLINGNYETIQENYLRSLFRLDEVHQYRIGTRVFHGIITGINVQGQLLVNSGGITSKYNFKEIEYIL